MKKTFVVMGVSRGGTTMVAGCMRLLGIDMGDDIDPICQEDRAFHHKTVNEVRNLIVTRNEQKDVWGWKFPHTHDFFFEISQVIVNPHLIFVFRDVYAVAESFNKRSSMPLNVGLREAWSRYGKVISVAEKIDCPKIFFSYEHAILNKQKYTMALSDFCGVELNNELLAKIIDFISPGNYQKLVLLSSSSISGH